MKISNILYFLLTILTATVIEFLIPPIIANAAPSQEVCLAEESVGVPRADQRFVIVDASGAETE